MNESAKLFMHERNKANKDLKTSPTLVYFDFSGTQDNGLPSYFFFAVLGLFITENLYSLVLNSKSEAGICLSAFCSHNSRSRERII